MKYVYLLIIGALIAIACESEPKLITEENLEADSFESMNLIANQIINNGLDPKLKSQNIKLGKKLYNYSSLKLVNNQLSDSVEECLFQWAALGAEASDRYEDAIVYFYKAQRSFPESVNAPKYLHNRARILEDKIRNKKAARLAYEELIQLYPENPLSVNSKIYLDNLFDKSESEIIDLILSK